MKKLRKKILKTVGNCYPFNNNYHRLSNGHEIHYIDEGEGPIVVMVHGNPSWSFLYREVALYLKANYRVIVPDLIGFGLSSRPEEGEFDFTLKGHIQAIEELMNHLDVTNKGFHLIVHDWGGPIGLGFARKYPSALQKIVLLNTSCFTLPETRGFHLPLRFARTGFGKFLARRLGLFSIISSWFCTAKTMPRQLRLAYNVPYSPPHNTMAVMKFVEDIPLSPSSPTYIEMNNIEEFIKNAKNPVRIFWGMKDFIFDEHFLRKFKEILPNAKVTQYENGGHYLLEDSGPEIICEIEKFLKS